MSLSSPPSLMPLRSPIESSGSAQPPTLQVYDFVDGHPLGLFISSRLTQASIEDPERI